MGVTPSDGGREGGGSGASQSLAAHGGIPRGIEVLVKKASVDRDFREVLLTRRADAAREIDLELAPAEAMMLNAAPEAQLAAIIARTRVSPKHRPAFLGKVAIAMLAALGATVLGCKPEPQSRGIRPKRWFYFFR